MMWNFTALFKMLIGFILGFCVLLLQSLLDKLAIDREFGDLYLVL